MKQEPRGFVIRADMPLQLKGAHSLFRIGHELRGHNPFRERNMRPLHDRADRDGKRLAAILAFLHAGASGFARQLGYAVPKLTAARTGRTSIGPQNALKVLPRLCFIVKDRIREIGFFRLGHGLDLDCGPILA